MKSRETEKKKEISTQQIIKYIVLAPLYLIKGVFMVVQYIDKRLASSIRTRITLNYLGLYTLLSLIICIVMLIGNTVLFVSEDNQVVHSAIQNDLERYYKGFYTLDEVEERVALIAKGNTCGIKVVMEEGSIISDTYAPILSYKNTFELLRKCFTNRVTYSTYFIYYKSAEKDIVLEAQLHIVRPLNNYYIKIKTLGFFFVACYFVGFLLMWIFGNSNNKRILHPLYTMTKNAEKISISNMNERLDVSQAEYELKDLAITLNNMLDQLSNDYEKQKRFVSDVSHELRTPISIINGYTNLLKRWGKDDEDILNESIDAIISEAETMQTLVENLLTLVRSDNQTLKFKKDHFYIGELIEEIVRETKMINEKQHIISCHIQDELMVFMDEQMIKQTIRIFVDNAVKYTNPQGKISINCMKNSEFFTIQISDTGIGMTPEDLEYIFERFYRSDESRTRETGGHGLGLAIAKAIVIGHKGGIRVKSKVLEGSTFSIVFPIRHNT